MARKRRRRLTTNLAVGPINKGVFNLVQGPGQGRRVPQAFRWPSTRRFFDISKGGARDLREIIESFFDDHITKESPIIALEALRPAFELSQKYAPIDTGALRKSARLRLVQRATSNAGPIERAEITYGETGFPFYTVFVHEIRTYSHLPPTRDHFLTGAVTESLPQIRKRIEKLTRLMIGVK